MGSKKGRLERLVYHDLIYLSRGRSTPKLVSGMGLTHTKGIRIYNIRHAMHVYNEQHAGEDRVSAGDK